MENTTFYITEKDLDEFYHYLQERENTLSTIKKYIRDVRNFIVFNGDGNLANKEKLLEYKEWLQQNYAVSSVNSMLAALNQYLIFRELGKLRLKKIKMQKFQLFKVEKSLEKEEFQKLVKTARENGNDQIAMIMETMCATGIRISELKFFRVENIRNGVIRVWNKGKYRVIVIPAALKKKLLIYIGKNRIKKGMIFCTRTGKEKDRSNIWREMKKVAGLAGVNLEKVFPHNLRHLFARTFYRETKNLVHLADLLGHSSMEVTKIYASDGIKEWRKSIEKIKLLETTT